MNGRSTLGLFVALFLSGVAAACGPSVPAVAPADQPLDATAPTAPSAELGTPPPVPTAAPTSATPGDKPAASGGNSRPVTQSKLIEDVKKAGIDVTKVASFDKLTSAQKKKLMPFFQKSLGHAACGGCHKADTDFKTETRNLKIAEGCFNTFVVPLRDEKGGAVFCDSCHNGAAKPLDRGDMDALKKFMEVEYVDKFTRADKQDQECGSCHSDTLELKIFANLWKVP